MKITYSFSRVSQPGCYSTFFIYFLTASSRIGSGKGWVWQGRFPEEAGQECKVVSSRWPHAKCRMKTPLGVLKKMPSASPLVDSCWPQRPVLYGSLSARHRVSAILWAGHLEWQNLDAQPVKWLPGGGIIEASLELSEGVGQEGGPRKSYYELSVPTATMMPRKVRLSGICKVLLSTEEE